MQDPILAARLDALFRSLKRAEKPSEFKDRFPDLKLEPNVWISLDLQMGTRVRDLLTTIRKIRGTLDAGEAWSAFQKAAQESQEVFRESLEILGGLAFRDKQLDERICPIADGLILDCSEIASKKGGSLAIPAPEEALSLTMSRIVRLPFPEWTIWTLPFVAHEYGHVALAEIAHVADGLCELTESKCLAHVQVLLSDAFATWVMGPSYVYAAVTLRFDPARREDARHPAHATRAAVIFGVLERMSEEKKNPYQEVIKYSRKAWGDVLSRSAPPTGNGANSDAVNKLIDELFGKLDNQLFTAMYPHASNIEVGWTAASRWAAEWSERIEAMMPLENKVPSGSTIRDALNAAWICRIDHPDRVREIEDAALKLCVRISKKEWDEPEKSSDLSPQIGGLQKLSKS